MSCAAASERLRQAESQKDDLLLEHANHQALHDSDRQQVAQLTQQVQQLSEECARRQVQTPPPRPHHSATYANHMRVIVYWVRVLPAQSALEAVQRQLEQVQAQAATAESEYRQTFASLRVELAQAQDSLRTSRADLLAATAAREAAVRDWQAQLASANDELGRLRAQSQQQQPAPSASEPVSLPVAITAEVTTADLPVPATDLPEPTALVPAPATAAVTADEPESLDEWARWTESLGSAAPMSIPSPAPAAPAADSSAAAAAPADWAADMDWGMMTAPPAEGAPAAAPAVATPAAASAPTPSLLDLDLLDDAWGAATAAAAVDAAATSGASLQAPTSTDVLPVASTSAATARPTPRRAQTASTSASRVLAGRETPATNGMTTEPGSTITASSSIVVTDTVDGATYVRRERG